MTRCQPELRGISDDEHDRGRLRELTHLRLLVPFIFTHESNRFGSAQKRAEILLGLSVFWA